MNMPNEIEIREHLNTLKREVEERRTNKQTDEHGNTLSYGGPGLTKYDCQLVLTSLGQFLGFKVRGKEEWKTGHPVGRFRVLPGQINPDANDKREFPVPYHNRYCGRKKATADYVWLDESDQCVAVFEVDGRDNTPQHLPECYPVEINHPRSGTNNIFSFSRLVWETEYQYVPPVRAWVLFQIDNDLTPKNPWGREAEWWRRHFSKCAVLDGATVFRDTELFVNPFLEYLKPVLSR